MTSNEECLEITRQRCPGVSDDEIKRSYTFAFEYVTCFFLFRIVHATPEQKTKAFLLACLD
jgi:hypothetical protein